MKVITLVLTDDAMELRSDTGLITSFTSSTPAEYQGVVDEVTLLFGGKDYSPSTHRITKQNYL